MSRFTALRRIALMFSVVGAGICAMLAGCGGSGGHGPRGMNSTRETPALPALAQQGKLIFDNTPRYAGKYVGNRLSCNDCHLQSGTADFSAPMIDVAGLFPMYNKRAGHVISLKNRIQECFARSEAGTPPPEGSAEMQAVDAYIEWLSRGGVKGKPYQGRGFVKLPVLKGDAAAGKAIYASQCASCHGVDGAGVPPVLPALWGRDSYSDGAGMNNPAKMAGFVIHNMPQNHPGALTPQQAYDVAEYVHTKVRPKFNQAYRSY